jgi:hypothetical protein
MNIVMPEEDTNMRLPAALCRWVKTLAASAVNGSFARGNLVATVN